MKRLLFVIVFVCFCLKCLCISCGILTADSLSEKRAFGTLKFNPVQAVFSEIPVSFEIYRSTRRSMQIQAGYVFSYRSSNLRGLFESLGDEGTASDGYLFSYRRSPFNNDGGINIKVELRKFRHSLVKSSKYSSGYFAPQVMYKFVYYNDQKFTIKHGSGFTYYQTESKHLSSFGLGLIWGHQSCYYKFVIDYYAGFGLRVTTINSRINEISTYWNAPGYPKYPNTLESQTNIYPFINLGLRLGFEI